jgi:hypothetical protein
MAFEPNSDVLVAYLQREMYCKTHFAIEALSHHAFAGILNEADPHPKVEQDEKGNPIVPSRANYGEYFMKMAAKYIEDEVRRCENRWAEVPDGKDPKAKAEREALSNELEAAKEALKSRSDEGPGVDTILKSIQNQE